MMNRRNLTKASLWAVPTVLLASAAPAYATSPTTPPHTCDKKKCKPKAKGRKIKHPSGVKRWEIRFEKACEWAMLHSDTPALALSPIPVHLVVWTPMGGKTRSDILTVDYTEGKGKGTGKRHG